MVNNSKIYSSVILTLLEIVLVLNAIVRKSADLLGFNQTHNAALFSSTAKHLLYKHVTPTFAGEFFRVNAGETWCCFCRFIFVHFDFCLISIILQCRYASRTLRIKLHFHILKSDVKPAKFDCE